MRPGELAKWEDAWRAKDGPKDLFRAGHLDHGSVTVLAAYRHDAVVAGAILNCSSTVVGISNVFVGPGAGLDLWPACLALAGELFPGKPVVGYESGVSLLQAERNGFQTAGSPGPSTRRYRRHTEGLQSTRSTVTGGVGKTVASVLRAGAGASGAGWAGWCICALYPPVGRSQRQFGDSARLPR